MSNINELVAESLFSAHEKRGIVASHDNVMDKKKLRISGTAYPHAVGSNLAHPFNKFPADQSKHDLRRKAVALTQHNANK